MPMQIGTFHSQHCQVKEKGADLRQHDRKVFLLTAIIFIEPAFIGSVKKKSFHLSFRPQGEILHNTKIILLLPHTLEYI
jgi:hypothetical protein